MNTAVASLSRADQEERYRVIFAGICALILTVGLARFAYTPMLPIMREQAGHVHKFHEKTPQKARALSMDIPVAKNDLKKIKKLLGR